MKKQVKKLQISRETLDDLDGALKSALGRMPSEYPKSFRCTERESICYCNV